MFCISESHSYPLMVVYNSLKVYMYIFRHVSISMGFESQVEIYQTLVLFYISLSISL